jgi:phosphate:Na+ symporter
VVELGWYGFLQLLGALALFIYGLKVLSEGVQRIATLQLRESLERVTQGKLSSFLTGFLTTAAVQSSSATTVMTISFVNAGIISLTAAAGIIVGANAGTIVTVGMVTILGFELNLFTLCLPLIGLTMPFFFIRNGKYRHWAETVIGFSLLLLSLQFMKSVVPQWQAESDVLSFVARVSDDGIFSVIFFILLGTLLSALIQSSSAAVALTMTMCLNGWMPFEIAMAMVLGENIGTTFSTEVASWVGNYEAKVAARFHVLFNIIGVLGFLPFMPLIIAGIIRLLTDVLHLPDPRVQPDAVPLGLAVFYTIFNIVWALVFLMFTPWLLKLAERSLPAKAKTPGRLYFIDTGSNSADLSVPVVVQEILQQVQRIRQLTTVLNQITHFTTAADYQEQMQFASASLKTLQENQKAINDYLINLVEDQSSLMTSREIKSLLNISFLIRQLTTKYEEIFHLTSHKRQNRIWFGPTQRSSLLFRIHDTDLMLRRLSHLLQSKSLHGGGYRAFTPEAGETPQHDQENERELLAELDRGELKLESVLIYYQMGQLLDTVNAALRTMIADFEESGHDVRQVRSPFLGRPA